MSRSRIATGPFLIDLLALGLLAVLLTAGFIFLRPRAVVDWTDARAVVLESDDWGLCGFTPDRATIDGADVAAIAPGDTPGVYRYSTLESAADVNRLAALLSSHVGRDDFPAVLQANYIVSSLSCRAGEAPGDDLSWDRASLPELPATYARPGLWGAVREAVAEGVWWPEYHGLWHYNPEDRMERVVGNAEAARVAARGLLIYPGIATSYELADGRDPARLAAELAEGLEIFADLFDRDATSVIAPDYAWNRDREVMWREAGLGIVQAKREQRSLTKVGATLLDRLLKVVERSWRYLSDRRLDYLNRNCHLEGAQAADPDRHAAACLVAVQDAWRNGEPAIIATHRVNYANLDSVSCDLGHDTLDRVLTGLRNGADTAPLYLTDPEIAQLSRRGVSARDTGSRILVRNLSHSRRPVLLPCEPGQNPRIVWLSPGTSVAVARP